MKIGTKPALSIVAVATLAAALLLLRSILWSPDSKESPTITGQLVDTSDWETYENSDYGYSFRYPTDWSVTEPMKEGGVYLASEAIQAITIEPDRNPIAFAPAGRCTLQVFVNPSDHGTLTTWVDGSGLYADNTGLTHLSRTYASVGEFPALLAMEGSANAQVTSSYYFSNEDGSLVFRFGFYRTAELSSMSHASDFDYIQETCRGILLTMKQG